MSTTFKAALMNWAALVALWAPIYLSLIEYFDTPSLARSELFQWGLVLVGACGLASILYAAWKDTRDPAWRASHRLTPRGDAQRHTTPWAQRPH